jgi:hypothetical protein
VKGARGIELLLFLQILWLSSRISISKSSGEMIGTRTEARSFRLSSLEFRFPLYRADCEGDNAGWTQHRHSPSINRTVLTEADNHRFHCLINLSGNSLVRIHSDFLVWIQIIMP